MSEKRFCYCCGIHHAQEVMRLFQTRSGTRWRCVSSIEAAARSRPERDLFGQRQTALNRQEARRQAEFTAGWRQSRWRES